MTWTIKTTDAEDKALFDLSEQLDLPVEKIFIQALRVYQAWKLGRYELVEVDPLPKKGCGLVE